MSLSSDGRSLETIIVARRRYSIGARLLSYLSAIWCGYVLLVLAVLWTAGFISLVPTFYSQSTPRLAVIVGAPIALFVASVIEFALGVAFGRFLLRAMPPYLLSETTRRELATIAVCICAPLISIFIFVMLLSGILGGVDAARNTTWDEPLIFVTVAAGMLFVIVWSIGAVGPLILRHGRPRAFLRHPFVLFLRRFSTFSDRKIVALILSDAKAGVPVVFLTPMRSRPRDWDPFLVGFAGLKLLHPLRSVPLVFRAGDDDWQRAADELIGRAQTILVDISEGSASLEAEAEMIEKAGRRSNRVYLKYIPPAPGSRQKLNGAFENARCIKYSKTWKGALPRLAISLSIRAAAKILFRSRLFLRTGKMWMCRSCFQYCPD